MLITFKSPASPEVSMLPHLAEYLLDIIGKHLGEHGVITHQELPAAIEKLESAIVTDRDTRAEHEGRFHQNDEDHVIQEMPLGLAQRAYPFLAMLRAARDARKDILWGI